MSLDIGVRLLRAGLISRIDLAQALAQGQAQSGGQLIGELVLRGLSTDAVVSLLVAEGFGPVVTEQELQTSEPWSTTLDAEILHTLIALPLFQHEGHTFVAMADPSDKHAVRELALMLKTPITPRVAHAEKLLRVLRQLRMQENKSSAPEHTAAGPQETALHWEDEETTERGSGTPESETSSQDAEHEVEREERSRRISSSFEREQTNSYELPQGGLHRMPTQRLTRPSAASTSAPADSWKSLSSISPRTFANHEAQTTPPARNSWVASPAEYVHDPATSETVMGGSVFEQIRRAPDPDSVAQLTCHACLAVARCAVFLRYRKRVFEGWHAAGADVSKDALRNLRIPTGTLSVFQELAARGTGYMGPHGNAPADILFRVAVRSRGGVMMVQPVFVHGRLVGALCVDELHHGQSGGQRVMALARVSAEAFERIVQNKKTGFN